MTKEFSIEIIRDGEYHGRIHMGSSFTGGYDTNEMPFEDLNNLYDKLRKFCEINIRKTHRKNYKAKIQKIINKYKNSN